MNREEILSKVQKEKKGYDEREQLILIKSSGIAKFIGTSLCLVMAVIELICFDRKPIVAISALVVCFFMDTFETWYRFAYLKGRLNLIRGIVCSVFLIGLIICLAHFFCKGY